jgi:ABC-type taurine transport system substrate-binding protein
LNRIGGVTVSSVLASSVVRRGFIGGVTVSSVLASSVVRRGFIGGVTVSVLASSVVRMPLFLPYEIKFS